MSQAIQIHDYTNEYDLTPVNIDEEFRNVYYEINNINEISDDLIVVNDLTINGDLSVLGDADMVNLHLDGYLDVDGATTLNNTLDVDGATTLNSTLGVTGTSTLAGVTATSLTVSGATALNGGITVDGTAFIVADTSGNVTTAGTLTVAGLATFNGGITADGGVFTVADTSGNLHTSGTFDSDGAATFNSTVTIDGNTTVRSGSTIQANDSGNTKSIALSHDGTDGLITSTQAVAFVSGTGAVGSKNGATFYVNNSDNTKNINFSHNGTNGLISTGSGRVSIASAAGITEVDDELQVVSGNNLKLVDSGGTKNLSLTHNGTNGSINTSSGGLTFQLANDVFSIGDGATLYVNNTGDTKNINFSHNGTDGVIDVSSGNLAISDNTVISGTLNVTGLISQNSLNIWPTQWTTWSPTYTASGAMTLSSVSTVIARYCQIGKIVFFEIYTTATTGGTASNSIRFTLPVTPANSGSDNTIGGGCWVIDTTAVSGLWGYSVGGYIQCFKGDATNFGLGASRAIKVQGFYEVA